MPGRDDLRAPICRGGPCARPNPRRWTPMSRVGVGLARGRNRKGGPRGTRNSWARACLFVLGFAALTPTYRPTGLSGRAHERAPICRGGPCARPYEFRTAAGRAQGLPRQIASTNSGQHRSSTVGWGERSEPQRRPPHPQNGIPGGHKFPETVGRTEGACGRIPGRHKACPYKLRAGTTPILTNGPYKFRAATRPAPTVGRDNGYGARVTSRCIA